MMDGGSLPKLIAFDLDYTLWDMWIDTHVEPPLKQDRHTGVVYDSAHDPMRVEFYKDVPEILSSLKAQPGVYVAAASRTAAIKLAREALRLIQIPVSFPIGKDTTDDSVRNGSESLPAIDFFDRLEIYPGSKLAHFEQLHKVTGIPYSEMLFFDDEKRNREVEGNLGVTFILIEEGVNWEIFLEGLREWRKRRAIKENASPDT